MGSRSIFLDKWSIEIIVTRLFKRAVRYTTFYYTAAMKVFAHLHFPIKLWFIRFYTLFCISMVTNFMKVQLNDTITN